MKISLICAYPVRSNPGMKSVDLAFETIRPLLNSANIDRLCSWGSIKNDEPGSIEYNEYVSITQLEDADKIIFWGDFLHWINYGNIDWLNKWKKVDSTLTSDKIIDNWYKLFLLEGRPDLHNKTIIFGGTLYGLNSSQLSDTRYFNALKNLYTNTTLCMTRDIVSENLLKQLTNNNKIYFGCDCAFLFDSTSLINLYQQYNYPDSKYLIYSFGRSGNSELLTRFATEIANEMGLVPIQLDWLKKKGSFNDMAVCISLIKRASVVITDIYHCTVTSYRENIPTICVGNGSSVPHNTLSDNKKEIFHYQHFINDRYRYVENIQKNFEAEKKQSIEKISNKNAQHIINEHLCSHIKKTKDILINGINV